MEVEHNRRVAGIDVSKAGLEVWVEAGPARRFSNNVEGIGALVEWLGHHGVNEAVYEPTGGYELEVGQRLREKGIKARRVHPNKVRGLARAWGKGAKTDGVDAQVLGRYGDIQRKGRRGDRRRAGKGGNTGETEATATVGEPEGAGTESAGQGSEPRGTREYRRAHRVSGQGNKADGHGVCEGIEKQ